eukprot:symbB.v1.2.009954.t1/scaffold559.1/size321893/9
MGPAKKTNEPAAEPNPKKRIKRTEKQEDKKNATTAVEAPDAADESVSTQMVNKFMKLKRCTALWTTARSFLQQFKAHGLTNLKWFGQYTETRSEIKKVKQEVLEGADLDQSQLSKAVKDPPLEVKVEYPKKVAFVATVKVANSGIKRLERHFTDGHRSKAQLQASMPSNLAGYNKQPVVFAEFLDKFRSAVATAGKLSKTDLDEDKSLQQEKKTSEWSCKATEHLDEITLLHKRARGWLA